MRLYGSISSSALRHNLSRVRVYSPESKIMGVVKANGYGHGLVRVARILQQSDIDALAVATVDEAVELRDSGITCPICVLSGFCDVEQVSVVKAKKIDCVVYCGEQIRYFGTSRPSGNVGIWIKVDTGMNRLGFPVHQLPRVLEEIKALAFLEPRGIMSHFACADELDSNYTIKQTDLFVQHTQFSNIDRSIANSAGIISWPDSHLEWVRPGIMLYGISPFPGMSAKTHDLRPVMELFSTVLAVKQLRSGQRVGYGQTWTCNEDTRIGIVGCGYGDGYFRALSSRAQVLIEGRRADVVGRVSMDSLAINLNGHRNVGVGSEVKLLGEGLSAEDLAAAAGTIPYEILTSVISRPISLLESH